MRVKTVTKLAGRARIVVYDRDGRAKQIIEPKYHNLMANVGEGKLGDLMIGATTSTLDRIKLGSSSQAAAENDTSVVTPLTPDQFLIATADSRLRTNNVITISAFVNSIIFTRPQTVREVGVFFSDGTLFARFVLATVDQFSLDAGDMARVDYDITIE